MKKTASLAANLIATKGAAAPSAISSIQAAGQGTEDRIAITVKLLRTPYLRMKAYGAKNRTTNQNMLEEALNDYLDKIGA